MSGSKSNVKDDDINTDASFVSRWSRLKHENKQTDDDAAIDAVDDAIVDTTAKQSIASDEEQQAPVKILTDADMPDIESMTADSDYTDFLSPGVSEELRRLALRKLFRSEVFNIRDGLDEYDGDYTHFEKLGDIVTSDMKHQLELEAKRKAEQALQEESADERADDRAGEDGISEMDIDSDDSADKNKIAANQQGMSQSSHDDAQTLTDLEVTGKQAATEQVGTEKALSDDSLTVAASAGKNTKEPDENAGFADTTINKADQNED
jgi:hypothetical protein